MQTTQKLNTAIKLIEETYIPLIKTPSTIRLFKALNIPHTQSKQKIISSLKYLDDKRLNKVIGNLYHVKRESKPKIKQNTEKTISDTYKRREISAKQNNIPDYKQYLKSDRWKKVREQAKKNTLLKNCFFCKSPYRLELHHVNYKHLGSYEELKYSRGLVTTCRSCHQSIHNISSTLKTTVQKATAIHGQKFKKDLPW